MRRATKTFVILPKQLDHFYPRSTCGERHTWQRGSRITYVISIHALLAESDDWPPVREIIQWISIHALLAESDEGANRFAHTPPKFLSTLSLRRATLSMGLDGRFKLYFYPRSPCGERRANSQPERPKQHISIHALLAESDTLICPVIAVITISIHALLAESDADKDADWVRVYVFLSTLSLRRATCARLRACLWCFYFYPRSPCGERRALLAIHTKSRISIHALLAESDSSLPRS